METPEIKLAVNVRDRIAEHLANAILRAIATQWYRDRVRAYIRIGMATVAAQAAKPEGD